MNKIWWALWVFKVPANIRWYSSVQITSTWAWSELFSTTVIKWLDRIIWYCSMKTYGFWEAIIYSSTVKYFGSQQSKKNPSSDLRLWLQKNNVKSRFYIFTGVLLCCLYRKEDFCCWRKNWDCLFRFFLNSQLIIEIDPTTTTIIWNKENTQP